MNKLDRRNKYCFGLGTIGRDMFYSMESMYLLYFLTEIRQLDDKMLALVGGVIIVASISIWCWWNDKSEKGTA